MPLQRCVENKKPGFKYGETGKCYTYERGNERQRREARRKAEEQGRAIETNKSE